MTRTHLLVFSLILPLSLGLACKKKVPPEPMMEPVLTEPVKTAPQAPAPVQEIKENFQRVNFAFDSSALSGDTRSLLSANAAIMAGHPSISLEIQGHCDERGTTDYNLALGERRARAVRDYLVNQGVAPSRVKTVSFGEERPLQGGATEVAWAQNRRAEFRITAGEDQARGTTN